jgi:hypothetical protein
MAKQIECRIKGRIDDYSLYHDRLHGYLVRRTGGVTSKQYRTDNRYEGARATSSEFSAVSKAGKLIRDAFGEFALQVKDGTMVNRMNKELVMLKQLDNKHPRGERRPETMITDLNANQYFRIFQFNDCVKTYELTTHFPTISKQQTALNMKDLKLKTSMFPEGATHAGLTLVRTVIDFEKKYFETHSSQMALVLKGNNEEPSLIIDKTSSFGGVEITCLQVVFFCEKDAKLIQLKGNVHSMGIIEVSNYKANVKLRTRNPRNKIPLRPDFWFTPQKPQLGKQESLPKNHPT